MPSWLVLLAAFNQDMTGIPWVAGFAMASVLALVITVVADRRASAPAGRRALGRFAWAVITWSVAFAVLAIVMSAASDAGAALFVIPFIGATIAALAVHGARRALGGRP